MPRLSVPNLESATGATASVYAQIKKAIGSIPNTFAAIGAHGPEALKAILLADNVLAAGNLTKRDQETIKLVISGVGPEPKEVDLVGEIVVGRSPTNDVQIEGDLVSRRHARFFLEGERWHVEDLESRNKTKLGDALLPPGRQEPLQDGDVISFGSVHSARASSITLRTP